MDKYIKIAAWAGIVSFIGMIGSTWAMIIGSLAGIVAAYGFYRIASHEKMKWLKVTSVLLMLATVGALLLETFYMTDAKLDESFSRLGEQMSELGITNPKAITEEQAEQLGPHIIKLSSAGLAPYVYELGILGIAVLLFGITLLPLKKLGKLLVPWTAGLNIGAGAAYMLLMPMLWIVLLVNLRGVLYASYILSLMLFLSGTGAATAATILEIILLFRAAKKYR